MKVKEESENAGLKLNIQKTKIMAFCPITSWRIDGETMETVTDFIFLGSKITPDGDCSYKIKRRFLLGGKAMTNLSSVQSLSRAQLYATTWTATCEASLSIFNSRSLVKLMAMESVMPSNYLVHCCPAFIFSCLQSFPASGSFSMSQFSASGGQSIRVSALASVLPMNIQD